MLEDYFQAIDEFARLAESVHHTIHSIMDRRDVKSAPATVLRALRYGNTHIPDNIGLRVIVNPGLFTRIMVDVGRTTAPKLVNNVHYVGTLREAYELIARETTSE